MKRSIQLINFKKHAALEMEFPGNMIAFVGKNDTGKSSIIQAIEATYTLDSKAVADPIKHGEEKGQVVREGKDRNGNPIVIEWNIEPGKSTFRAMAVDEEGKRKVISDAKRIRELIGTYFPLTVHEAFNMIKTAEGRAKFIQTYIMGCLEPKQRERIDAIDLMISDKKNKNTENNLFNTRTVKRAELKAYQNTLESYRLTVEEEKELELEPERRKNYDILKEEEQKLPDSRVPVLMNAFDDVVAAAEEFAEKFDAMFNLRPQDMIDNIEAYRSKVLEKQTEYDNFETERQQIIARRTKADVYFQQLAQVKAKKGQFDGISQSIVTMSEQVEILDRKIEDLRAERKQIIASANLPAGLNFTEDTIMLGEFIFDETVVSETKARIAVIELILAISSADFIDIGDWSLYDKASKKAIMSIAKKRDCMIFGQLVTDDDNVQCETIITE